MKVLGLFDAYITNHRSGAERMEHNILRGLVEKGHEAKVICRNGLDPHVYERIAVFNKDFELEKRFIQWADILITSFMYSRRAMNLAKDFKRPLVVVIHNELNPDIMINSFDNIRVIYNSNFVGAKCKFRVPSIVFNPPVFESDWTGKWIPKTISLLNVGEIKGGDKFIALAKELPQYKFFGTKGSYTMDWAGMDNITRDGNALPNCTIIPNTNKPEEIYQNTKILLMPSRYESFGQTQIEAGFYGIPTIYHPTPGLVESWGEYGIPLDRNDHEAWKNEIIRLMKDKEYYKERSQKAKEGSLNHQAKSDWNALIKFMSNG